MKHPPFRGIFIAWNMDGRFVNRPYDDGVYLSSVHCGIPSTWSSLSIPTLRVGKPKGRVEVSVVEARSAEHQKPRGVYTPKGSPRSLIYLYKGKVTSFVMKQFFTSKKEHQTLMRSRLRRFCFVRHAHLRKTSTCAEKSLNCSHNDCVPRVLRMTRRRGRVPSTCLRTAVPKTTCRF